MGRGAPNILKRLGITQEELEAKYEVVGNLRTLADMLGVSKTTLQKYLKHKAHDTKPWASKVKGEPISDMDYLRYKYRKEAMASLEEALATKTRWKDVNGRVIPREALEQVYAEPPRKMLPIMPVYATLKGGGTTAIFMFHPEVDWIDKADD